MGSSAFLDEGIAEVRESVFSLFQHCLICPAPRELVAERAQVEAQVSISCTWLAHKATPRRRGVSLFFCCFRYQSHYARFHLPSSGFCDVFLVATLYWSLPVISARFLRSIFPFPSGFSLDQRQWNQNIPPFRLCRPCLCSPPEWSTWQPWPNVGCQSEPPPRQNQEFRQPICCKPTQSSAVTRLC